MNALAQQTSREITYGWTQGKKISEKEIEACRCLFSSHYGVWGEADPKGRTGKPVRLPTTLFKQWFSSERTVLYWAKCDGVLVGYAIAAHIGSGRGRISWVTQLVVHTDYRRQGIAKTLLFSAWGFSNQYAWGLVTASPYAVRSLERATRRRVDPAVLKMHIDRVVQRGTREIHYVPEGVDKRVVTEREARINTGFFVSHREVRGMLAQVSKEAPWVLGSLKEGWEWLAFTFRKQPLLDYTAEELEALFKSSEQIVQDAYGRMRMSSKQHHWMKGTKEEVAFIVNQCHLSKRHTVVDLGCGIGRHTLELASHCAHVTGVDYAKRHIDVAKRWATQKRVENVVFETCDCRTYRHASPVDAVLCVYDVVGTYVEVSENRRILETVVNLLKPGGRAVLSVMNYTLTEHLAKEEKATFSLAREPSRLVNLQPSNTMECTGEVFNPKFFLLDTTTHVVYRKEQFRKGEQLPAEFIVRDRRFTMEEIQALCEAVGLCVDLKRYVKAKAWDKPLKATDKHAKEILLVCHKPTSIELRFRSLRDRLLKRFHAFFAAL